MSIKDLLDKGTNLDTLTGEEAIAALVGDGKKYATAEELAKAAVHSQAHIAKLEQEAAELRDASLKAKGVDDILAALKGDGDNGDGNSTPAPQEIQNTPIDAQALIDDAFAKRDAQAKADAAKQNVDTVVKALQDSHGDKALATIQALEQELGIDFDSIASKSPEAALRLVQGSRQAPNPNQHNGLPQGRQQAPDQGGSIVDKAAIDKMYSDGKISRHQKVELENKQLTALGADKFWNRK